MIHNVNDLPPNAKKECKFIISGHTHKYTSFRNRGQVYLNPGSASQDRSGFGCTMMLLHLEADDYRIEQVLLSP